MASFGEVAEKSLEERKAIALEAIAEALAEAVGLWIVSTIDEDIKCKSTTDSIISNSLNRTRKRRKKRRRKTKMKKRARIIKQ